MAYAAGAKIFKDAGETVSDIEQQLSQALVEVEANAQPELKVNGNFEGFRTIFTLKYWPG